MSEETSSSSTGMGSSDATAANPGRGGVSRGILIGGLVAVIAIVGVVLVVSKSGGARSGAGGVYVVGNTGPGGGIVFYVASTPFACGPTGASTCNYLEASPHGWQDNPPLANPVDPTAAWNVCSSPQVLGLVIGSGAKNTSTINTACSTDTTTAGFVAANYRGNSLTDWYLPARDEFEEMMKSYVIRTQLGFDARYYWTSSAGPFTDNALSWLVPSTSSGVSPTTSVDGIRPIRAF